MYNFISLLLIAVSFGLANRSNEPIATQYGDGISSDTLKSNLSILAADDMEGRETGKRGQKMAGEFIREHFEEIGLKGPVDGKYYQPFELYTITPGETYVKTSTVRFDNFGDMVYYGSDDSGGEVSVPLVFVGNGTVADLEQVDVRKKAVLMFTQSDWIAGSQAVNLLRERGAHLVLACNTNGKEAFLKQVTRIKAITTGRGLSLEKPDIAHDQRPGLFIVSSLAAAKLMGVPLDGLLKAAAEIPAKKSIGKIKPVLITYKTSTAIKVIETENVLGILEGTDKKDEVLVISAHYDHIGVKDHGTGDLINNGADDDGSGTVAVMEIARVFATAKRDGHGPRRSMLFMTFTAEESGLLGSEFYSGHPIIPLGQTVVDLNIDMVGRRDAIHMDSPPYVYVIGADKLSSELNAVSEAVNEAHEKLIFDYTYNDQSHPERLYYRSDHWNFAKHGIPIIFYFDGLHPDYHRPGDEVEKIEFDLLRKRTQCVFYTAWEIANRDERIRPDEK